jgi:hypothetical protein
MLNGNVSSIRQPMTAFRYSFRFVRPGRHRGLCINSLCPSQTAAVVYAALSVWQLAPASCPLQPSYGATGSAQSYPIRSGIGVGLP